MGRGGKQTLKVPQRQQFRAKLSAVKARDKILLHLPKLYIKPEHHKSRNVFGNLFVLCQSGVVLIWL